VLSIAIRILEDEQLGRELIREIIPFLLRIEVNLRVLEDSISIDYIASHGVKLKIHGFCITHCHWPIYQWAL
jgi:hypothetical protein